MIFCEYIFNGKVIVIHGDGETEQRRRDATRSGCRRQAWSFGTSLVAVKRVIKQSSLFLRLPSSYTPIFPQNGPFTTLSQSSSEMSHGTTLTAHHARTASRPGTPLAARFLTDGSATSSGRPSQYRGAITVESTHEADCG